MIDTEYNYNDDNTANKVEFDLTSQYKCNLSIIMSKYNGYIANISFIDKIMGFKNSVMMSIEEFYLFKKELETFLENQDIGFVYSTGPNCNYAEAAISITKWEITIEKYDIFKNSLGNVFKIVLDYDTMYYFKEQIFWLLIEYFPEDDDGNLE